MRVRLSELRLALVFSRVSGVESGLQEEKKEEALLYCSGIHGSDREMHALPSACS